MKEEAHALVDKITSVIIDPLIALIFAAGLLVFVFGVVEFMWEMQGEVSAKEKGKQHMLWGIIGMFIMVASYAILKIVANTLSVPYSY